MNIWDTIVIIILIISAINGYRQGFIKALFSMIALILIMVVTFVFTPVVASFLKSNTNIHNTFKNEIYSKIDLDYDNSVSVEQILDELKLPSHVKDIALDSGLNNVTNTIDTTIHGVIDSKIDALRLQIADYIAGVCISILSAIITFVIASIAVMLIINISNLFSKLPVINSMNKIAGIAIGFLQGVLLIWILSLFISFFANFPGFSTHVTNIQKSSIEHHFYESNPLWNFIKLDVDDK